MCNFYMYVCMYVKTQRLYITLLVFYLNWLYVLVHNSRIKFIPEIRAKTNILNESERIIFATNEYLSIP